MDTPSWYNQELRDNVDKWSETFVADLVLSHTGEYPVAVMPHHDARDGHYEVMTSDDEGELNHWKVYPVIMIERMGEHES